MHVAYVSSNFILSWAFPLRVSTACFLVTNLNFLLQIAGPFHGSLAPLIARGFLISTWQDENDPYL